MAEPALALDDRAARERVARVEVLLEELEGSVGAVARDTAFELVEALIDLYGEGLSRMVSHVARHDDRGEMARACAEDELVSHLLLLHGLHPVSVDERVRGALDEVRPYLESHGGGVELLGIDAGVARLRLQGSCDGCASSTATLKLAIEDAIHKAAPDIERVEAEGAVAPAPAPALLQIEVSDALRAPAEPDGAWAVAGAMPELEGGGTVLRDVAGRAVLVLGLGGARYAYRPGCPGCGTSLEAAVLEGAELTCAGCGRRYDVRGAGRCVDAPGLQLEPVPLLVDGSGLIRIALGAAA
jgi:Fe-S cluster biogenesis protein NfuA/nitrite reductase/ring-hydroxylating ferredoxin subunit